MLCASARETGKKGDCMRRNVTYETYCLTCEEIREKEEKEVERVSCEERNENEEGKEKEDDILMIEKTKVINK